MGEKERLAEELPRQQALYAELKKMRGRGEEMDMLQQLEQVLIQGLLQIWTEHSTPQFYIQLLYRPHLGTYILPFGLLGSIRENF